MNTLGENIKACREKRNLSREELAKKLCIGPKKIEDYESGKAIPGNDTLLRLSTVLDIPISELTGSLSDRVKQHI